MDAVSKQDLDAAVAQFEAAEGSRQAAKAQVDQAEIQLGYTRITAPVDGLIGITQAKVGEYVGRSPNPVVLNVVSQTDPIRVRFSINEREYLRFRREFAQSMRDIRDETARQRRRPWAGGPRPRRKSSPELCRRAIHTLRPIMART